MQSTRIRRISLIAGLFLVAAGLHARAAQTFNYADNFNSYGQFAVPAGWVTQDAIVPALPPGVFTGDTSPWANKAISPPGGVVNYNVAWSGGRRFSLIHPVETPLDSFRAVSAWYQGQGEPAYPLNLQLNSLHAEFDVSIRTGSACEDFPTNGVISSADGMTFAVQPVSDLATDVTRVGEVGGVTVIDDYGHHPVEIAAVLRAARQACDGRVIAVHQPHRFTRLHSLFDDFCACFNEADVVGIAEVYAAGEDPIPGATQDDLIAGLVRHGHRDARAIRSEQDLARLVRDEARPGDMVVCLGAGTISAWANRLPEKLKG